MLIIGIFGMNSRFSYSILNIYLPKKSDPCVADPEGITTPVLLRTRQIRTRLKTEDSPSIRILALYLIGRFHSHHRDHARCCLVGYIAWISLLTAIVLNY